MERWRLVLIVLLPFAFGFYLSFLFRMINAVIADDLVSELALDAASLGLLTSVYFLAFAAVQIPVGSWLDRYGPRRVQSVLLLIAAVGAVLFGMAESLPELVAARTLIGLGVAAAMMAGVKAIILWFPTERLPFFCGWFVMLGALGGVTATAPAELFLTWAGWRTLFMSLALLTAVCALMIYWIVPERPVEGPPPQTPAARCFAAIYTDARFWRLAPLSASCAGTAWAVQGLWAAPWLADVEQLDRALIVQDLFLVAVAVCIGAMVIGVGADRLRRKGIQPQTLLASIASLSIAAHVALVLRLPVPSFLPWAFIAAIGCATVLSYATLAQLYSKEFAGRANGALNVVHFVGAFVIQFAIGLVVEQWTAEEGQYPPIAYQSAFAVNLCFQIAALVWFAWPAFRVVRRKSTIKQLSLGIGACRALLRPISSYERTGWVSEQQFLAARAQARSWRLAALGSTTLGVLLALTLAKNTGNASAAPAVVNVDHRNLLKISSSALDPDRVMETQIEYFLARFIENVRSISADPVVVRANWLSAYDFVTARGARMLNEYAASENLFSRVGTTMTVVEVISITRLSPESFRIIWKEQIYENDVAIRADNFIATVTVVFKPPMTTESLRENPLGLYIRAINWRREPAVRNNRYNSRQTAYEFSDGLCRDR